MIRFVLLPILLFSQLVFATGGTSTKQIDTMAATGGTAIAVPSSGVWTIGTGGTGTSTAPTQGGVVYAASASGYASTAAGSSGQFLKSNGTSAPTWVTANLGTPVQETPSGTVNGSNATFTTTYTPTSNAILSVYLNGLILTQGVDYTVSSSTITITAAPDIGQNVYVTYSH